MSITLAPGGLPFLGHAHPVVVEAVQRAATEGLSFGAPTEREIEMAELLTQMLPSMEMVRLVSSGTEGHDECNPSGERVHRA